MEFGLAFIAGPRPQPTHSSAVSSIHTTHNRRVPPSQETLHTTVEFLLPRARYNTICLSLFVRIQMHVWMQIRLKIRIRIRVRVRIGIQVSGPAYGTSPRPPLAACSPVRGQLWSCGASCKRAAGRCSLHATSCSSSWGQKETGLPPQHARCHPGVGSVYFDHGPNWYSPKRTLNLIETALFGH